jgi:hypothetical protein
MEPFQILRTEIQRPPGILHVLAQLMELDATDPRDKILGLLGITDHMVVPDYALSTREVYTSFAKGGNWERKQCHSPFC